MKSRSNHDLVYLDQNILGLLNSGKVRLDGAGYTWVFSDIHFEGIARGSRTDLLEELAWINVGLRTRNQPIPSGLVLDRTTPHAAAGFSLHPVPRHFR